MSTHLFAFNPKLWNWPSLADDIRTLARRGHFDTEWSCGRFRAIEPGSRAFMVRLGVAPKGLIGSGVVMTAPA
jgi:5-methylcytosine-specific restriction protein A